MMRVLPLSLKHVQQSRHLLQNKFALGCATCTDFLSKSRTTLYFLQQLFATYNKLICCRTGLIRRWWNAQHRYSTFLYQCWKTSCTFLFSVLSYLYCQVHTLVDSSVTFFHDGHRRVRGQHGHGKLVSLVVRFKKLFFTKTLALHLPNEMSPNLD